MATSGGKLYDGHLENACLSAAIKPGASSRVNFKAAIRVIAPPKSPHINSSHTPHRNRNRKPTSDNPESNIAMNGRVKKVQIITGPWTSHSRAESNTSAALRADVSTHVKSFLLWTALTHSLKLVL